MSKFTCNFKPLTLLLCAVMSCCISTTYAQTQETVNSTDIVVVADDELIELNQAELDQILAPIALYPDTLLSHILVAATYPLEVIQATRWRTANKALSEEQALNAVEEKDWDPSVKALVPFTELLQKFSEDLDWLQALGDAFLANEPQVLASVQSLREKAYAQGNLKNSEYIEVEKADNEIIIQTVNKDVIYVPYYDTRVVYGSWWWDNYPPYFWQYPSYYTLSSGIYWSHRYYISPAFYYGGFRWNERYIYVDYNYRNRVIRDKSHHYNRQIVNSREYSPWQHNEKHRRGVNYRINGHVVSRDYNKLRTNPNRYVLSSHDGSDKKRQQIDKQRGLDVSKYRDDKFNREHRASEVQHQLKKNKPIYIKNDKQRLINQAANQQREQSYDRPQKIQKQEIRRSELSNKPSFNNDGVNDKKLRYEQPVQNTYGQSSKSTNRQTSNTSNTSNRQRESTNRNIHVEKPRPVKQSQQKYRAKD